MIDDEYQEYRFEEQDLRVIKTLLQNSTAANDFVNTYDEKLFVGDCVPVVREIIDCIKAYKVAPTPRILLERATKETTDLFQNFLSELNQIDNNPTEFKFDLEKIRQRFADEKVQSLRERLNDDNVSSEDCLKNLRVAIDEIQSIKDGTQRGFIQKTLRTYSQEFKVSYAERLKNPGLGQGILTGYSKLDHIKNGLLPGEMLIVGAETGGGKSLLLNNLAVQMWMQKNQVNTETADFTKGHNVLYFSLEMPFAACFERTISRLSDVAQYHVRDAKLSISEFEALDTSIDFVHRYPYEFEIVDIARGTTVDMIEARFLEARSRFNPEIIVVDYLGLMDDNGRHDQDWLKMGVIAEKLFAFARTYNVIVLTAVQLNRVAPAGKNKDAADNIGMHRIGRSALIMHNANLALQIEQRRNENLNPDMSVHIIKNRGGELGHFSLLKNLSTGRITDILWVPSTDQTTAWELTLQGDDLTEAMEKRKWKKRR